MNLLSWKSVKAGFSINAGLYTLTWLASKTYTWLGESFVAFAFTDFIKNWIIIHFLHHHIDNKPKIKPGTMYYERYPGELQFNIALTSVIRSTIVWSWLWFYKDNLCETDYYSFVGGVTSFVLRSFIFEIIFDGVHYTLHRVIHAAPVLYAHIHKKHHHFTHPNAQTTFYMSPSDTLLTHGIPLYAGLTLLPFSRTEIDILLTYLVYQEVGGHLDRRMAPTSSFAQFIWLPRWLNIELYTEDHDLHHSQLHYNYAKRFALWDKLFGTYKRAPHK